MTLSSVPRRCVSSRGNMSSTSLELNINRDNMMKKRKHLTTVTMEAGNGDFPIEPTGVKAKRLTGRHYKSLYVKAALASEKSEKRRSFQGEEERLHSASKEKRHMEKHVHSAPKKRRRLRKKYLQCSLEKINSGREDIGNETSNIDEGRSPVSYDMLKTVNSPLPQKLSFKNKIDEVDIRDVVNEIQQKCDKRMKKLIHKQEQQMQEFYKVWDAKISKVLEDKELEAAIIRTIYGEGSTTRTKLMILDDEFAKKEAENIFRRDVQLKDLEAKHLAAKNEESEKAANWLSKTKACISHKQMGCCNVQSLDSLDEKGSGCSESRTHILGVEDAIPLAGQHGENNISSRTGQEMHAVIDNNSDCAAAEEVGCDASNENPCNLVNSKKNEDGISFSVASIPTVIEQINQHGGSICADITASGEMRSLEMHRDVAAELPESVVDKIVDNQPVVSDTNSPIEGFRERDAIDLPVSLLNQRNDTDGTTIDDVDSAGQVLETSEQVKEDQGHANSSPKAFVSELVDTVTDFVLNVETQDHDEAATDIQSSARTDVATSKIIDSEIAEQSCMELQDQDAPVVKDLFILQKKVAESENVDAAASTSNLDIVGTAQTLKANIELQAQIEPATETQSTSRIEVAASEIMHNPAPVWASTAMQNEDALTVEDLISMDIEISDSGLADVATPVQSRIDGPATENCEQPQVILDDKSPSCNPLPSTELQSQSHNLERLSSGTAEIDKPSHGSTSQLREDVEIQSNNIDMEQGSQSSHEHISASFQNYVALEIEILHQDLENLLLGGVSRLNTHEVATQNSPSLFANPLRNELERSRKEIEELQKSHENAISCLKSEYEKEMQELVAQVQNKYLLKAQDAQAQFRSKKDGIAQNQKKLLMNKLLADSFSYKYLNCLPTGTMMQQGSPSIPTQQQQQQHLGRLAGATVSNLHIASLHGQAVQQISLPPPTRPGQINYAAPNLASVQAQLASLNGRALQQNSLPPSTRPGQIYAGPSAPAQAQHAAAISSLAARPGGNHHPTTNQCVGGYIHSSAPHYQASVPSGILSSLLQNYHQQQPRLSNSQNPQYFGYPTAL